jgi:hypothetical protein
MMSFLVYCSCWFARRGQRCRPHTLTQRARYRPTLQALETRDLLSTLTVTNLGDTGVSGDGSLRGAIAAAIKGDRIVFAPSLAGQTITLNAAKGPLVLGQDLTIQGLGGGGDRHPLPPGGADRQRRQEGAGRRGGGRR